MVHGLGPEFEQNVLEFVPPDRFAHAGKDRWFEALRVHLDGVDFVDLGCGLGGLGSVYNRNRLDLVAVAAAVQDDVVEPDGRDVHNVSIGGICLHAVHVRVPDVVSRASAFAGVKFQRPSRNISRGHVVQVEVILILFQLAIVPDLAGDPLEGRWRRLEAVGVDVADRGRLALLDTVDANLHGHQRLVRPLPGDDGPSVLEEIYPQIVGATLEIVRAQEGSIGRAGTHLPRNLGPFVPFCFGKQRYLWGVGMRIPLHNYRTQFFLLPREGERMRNGVRHPRDHAQRSDLVAGIPGVSRPKPGLVPHPLGRSEFHCRRSVFAVGFLNI
ncbi:unnamed protein product [Pseudo-nitzschia multistriata]|uniref:Uncharacterized protein n=1 Tax=Pseudo-nitzschia multistriata TaxID=183589 RepID=A0A448Z049_9STRA|nr:unnamed protein product [Pseudo-nitzschia multistriata]